MTKETAPAAGAGDGSEPGRNAGWSTFRMRSAGQRKKAWGSQRKSLKTLNPDKGVKGNPSPCISVRGSSWMFGRAQFVLVEQ